MPPSGLRWEGERSEQGTHEAPRHACELPPRGPALHIAGALGTRGELVNRALAVEKPELCCELHAAARPVLCRPRTTLQPAWVGSLAPTLRRAGRRRLTAAAASGAGSPWPRPLEGCSALGSGKPAGDQDWRPPWAHALPIPRLRGFSMPRACTHQREGEATRPPARPPDSKVRTVPLSLTHSQTSQLLFHSEGKAGAQTARVYFSGLYLLSEEGRTEPCAGRPHPGHSL